MHFLRLASTSTFRFLQLHEQRSFWGRENPPRCPDTNAINRRAAWVWEDMVDAQRERLITPTGRVAFRGDSLYDFSELNSSDPLAVFRQHKSTRRVADLCSRIPKGAGDCQW